jgi:hypothetical protein
MGGNRAQFANNLQKLHGNFAEWPKWGGAIDQSFPKKMSAPRRDTDFQPGTPGFRGGGGGAIYRY